MLRYRVIRAFVAVWCAVCLAYAGIRTAVGKVVERNAAPSEEGASLVEDASSERSAASESPAVEEPVATAETDQAPPVEPPVRTTPVGEPATGDASSQVESPRIPEEPEVTAEEETWDEPVAEPEALPGADEVPSLYEYLNQFICGRCRRRCSLANPRCHNGSRLADAKAQEYYDTYGI